MHFPSALRIHPASAQRIPDKNIKASEKIRANWWNWCHFRWPCKVPEWLQEKSERKTDMKVPKAIKSWPPIILALISGVVLAGGRVNLVYLMADDHRASCLGSRGDEAIHTPNLDRLAERGMSFSRCYATSPICMASRASVMTGLYEYRTGCNFGTGKLSGENWRRSYPMLLKKAGYRIAFAGKWGFKLDGSGYEKQFDKWGGFTGSSQGFYETKKDPALRAYAEKYPHVSLALGAFGRDFIAESAKAGKPFCLSISFKAPHKPHRYVVEETKALYRDKPIPTPRNYGTEALKLLPPQPKIGRQYVQRFEWLPEKKYQEHIRAYYRLISGIDMAVGMIVEALRENGVADNTVVIYTSDNGYFCGAHGLQGKVLPYNDASSIPLIVADPRNPEIAGKKSDVLVGNIDFAPTLLDFAGVESPEGLDGRSIVPALNKKSAKIRDSLLIVQNWGWGNSDFNRGLAVTDGRYKYIFWCYGDENIDPVEELFDLREDPYEMHNLAKSAERAEVLKKMRVLYDRHHAEWARRCADVPSYKEHAVLFNRHVPWRKKKFWMFPKKGSKSVRALKKAYQEVVGVPAK
jgi:arylsulfatase A-like enzyme